MSNPIRTCIGCTQSDDHPRHVVALADGSEVTWHPDCHALATGCAACVATVESSGGLRGDELRSHIVAGGAVEAVATAMEQTA